MRIAVIGGKMERFSFSPKSRKFRLEMKWKGLLRLSVIGTQFGTTFVPFNLTNLLSPVPLFCILLTRTITKRAVAWVRSVQLECTVPWTPLGMEFPIFRDKPAFLLNGKHPMHNLLFGDSKKIQKVNCGNLNTAI